MILAMDVYYRENQARAVGALFNWADQRATDVIIARIAEVEAYVPGAFYKRELPCLLQVIGQVDLQHISTIIIDGYVYTGNSGQPGLGARLWQALGETIPVIGVAKTSFHATEQVTARVIRGKSSTSPLFVSAVGMELAEAAELIKNMPGNYRMPDILGLVDKVSRE